MPLYPRRGPLESKTSTTRFMNLLGVIAACFFAIIIPSVYCAISINGMERVITTEAAFLARSIGKIIQARPELWEFESVRLNELISKPSFHGIAHEKEIRTAAGKHVIKTDFAEARPIISVSEPFFDSGRLAGSIIIRHSIRTQIITTVLLAIFSSLLGYLLYFIFRTYPLRKLENTLAELEQAHHEMEQRVVDRTEVLSRTNEKLRTEISMRREAEKAQRKSYDELRNVQSQLVQSGKLASIGELAAGVAHELNQPLMVVRTTAQSSVRQQRKNALDAATLLENLNFIEKNTKRMMNIINHLRTFSRQTDRKFAPVNVNETIQNAFLMIGQQLSQKNIKVIRDFSEGLPEVLGDANQLEQVFLNLLANGRDSMQSKFEAGGGVVESQKKIVITTHVSAEIKEAVEILFKDTGSGIPQEALNNIFDPFFTTKGVGDGTGLGLSISYGIIQDHKGEIDVVETGPEGTTFRVRLPMQICGTNHD
jgi:C4-dicarboxylate-specific signal transduction histidine kinase